MSSTSSRSGKKRSSGSRGPGNRSGKGATTRAAKGGASAKGATTSKSRPASSRRTTSRSRGRRTSNNGMFIWIFLGVLVVLFLVIAFISRAGVGGVEITDAEVTGEALPELGQSNPDGAIGRAAPSFSGQTLDGEAITVEPGDGTPKAILFLAHWCPHCQREVPTVVQWAEQGNLPEGVELIGVATGIDRNRPNFPPHEWLERENFDFPTVVDGNDAIRNAYGLSTYPYWVLVDGEGNVVERWSGETSADQLDVRIGQLIQTAGQEAASE